MRDRYGDFNRKNVIVITGMLMITCRQGKDMKIKTEKKDTETGVTRLIYITQLSVTVVSGLLVIKSVMLLL